MYLFYDDPVLCFAVVFERFLFLEITDQQIDVGFAIGNDPLAVVENRVAIAVLEKDVVGTADRLSLLRIDRDVFIPFQDHDVFDSAFAFNADKHAVCIGKNAGRNGRIDRISET